MTAIRIQHKSSYISAYILFTFIVLLAIKSLLSQSVEDADIFVSSVMFALGIVSWWVKFVQAKRWVEVDVARQKVVAHTKSLFFRSRISEYPLERFSSVRSYIAPGRYPMNQVELVTRAGGEALEVASMQPVSIAKSFWSTPIESESKEAATLRKEIATHASLVDLGFLGTRMVGAQIKK